MKTLQEIKDEVAANHNYENYESVIRYQHFEALKDMVDDIANAWLAEARRESERVMSLREIVFRARSKETGEWVEGNYHHNTRKGEAHYVSPKATNEEILVYRESLQMKIWNGEWRDM